MYATVLGSIDDLVIGNHAVILSKDPSFFSFFFLGGIGIGIGSVKGCIGIGIGYR